MSQKIVPSGSAKLGLSLAADTLAQLMRLIDADEVEPNSAEVQESFKSLLGDLVARADDCIVFDAQLEAWIEQLKEIKRAVSAKVKRAEEARQTFRRTAQVALPGNKVTGQFGSLSLQTRQSTELSIVTDDDGWIRPEDMPQVPPQFLKIYYKLDKDGLNRALRAGETFPFARLQEKQIFVIRKSPEMKGYRWTKIKLATWL